MHGTWLYMLAAAGIRERDPQQSTAGTAAEQRRSALAPGDKGSEWILSVARHRDPMADPVGTLRSC